LMVRAPQPDVLIAADGSAFTVRGADGRLSVLRTNSDTFAVREWLAADGDPRQPKDPTLASGIRCDAAGCTARLADGTPVAFAKTLEAFTDDCRRSILVVSARSAPAGCRALVIDRPVLQRAGAIALRRNGEGFEMTPTRAPGYDRPWSRGVAQDDAGRAPSSQPTPSARDAAPVPEDLGADD